MHLWQLIANPHKQTWLTAFDSLEEGLLELLGFPDVDGTADGFLDNAGLYEAPRR